MSDTVKMVITQATCWEKTFSNHISNDGPISRINKGLSKVNHKKTNSPVKTGQKILTDISPKKI